MRTHRLLAAVLSGIALPGAAFFAPHHFTKLTGSDLERLRGDASKVGNDFKNVISREHGKYEAAFARASAPADTRF